MRTDVPGPLAALHALIRRHRPDGPYDGRSLRRDHLDAVLTTACGSHTGSIEVRPAVFAVDGLPPGVYRYAADELELVRQGGAHTDVLAAALPADRATIGGAAVFVCLTGVLTRHEHRHGPGGYRLLAAEAGHLSQRLILAATALGVVARPFSTLFDDLLNPALGLDGDGERFVLGVLLGHAGEAG
ncbi:hypothetical protein GCM10012289_68160 [Nonomuraea cavernae]|uniref:Nitroreductase domain-containing protein n=1 Tax=Nonomuraea cavernae TaxID=2045107 RepID=A0A917ZDF4_9ACTN|nr:nitroreductase family protein [Nonomuraea cavernae]MCA2190364.1 nitroreductase family protein [Nonomuraea cavernae]GGO80761.1 hypothetical protein GCM10012289_68160 [Nonomuraea cavernae]